VEPHTVLALEVFDHKVKMIANDREEIRIEKDASG
jgi:hypothetical protein